jgi:hypothetical protein
VDRSPGGPRTHELGPRVSFRKIIPGNSNFRHFAFRPLGFFKINPQSKNLQLEESNFFCLGQSAMKWVVSPHSKQPLGDLLLSLRNLCNARNFLASRVISSSGMLSYCSSEAAHKEDKANSKADESVVLVGLAKWPPT